MKYFLVLLVCFFQTPVFAAYEETMQGSTQIEREIRWIWKRLATFTRSCAVDNVHCQTPEIKKVVAELQEYLPGPQDPNLTKWQKLLEFVSEKDRPDLFKPSENEAHRLAATELKKFGKVYINTDRMNLPYESWVAILAHEAVHHLGYTDDASRIPDQVGAEIEKHFRKQIQPSTLEQYKLPKSQFITFNSVGQGNPSVGFISVGDVTSDLNWAPSMFEPICNADEKMLEQFVSAPAWRVNRLQVKKGILTLRGGGFVRARCQQGSGKTRVSTFPLNAVMNLQYSKPLNLDKWSEEIPTHAFNEDQYGLANDQGYHMFGLAQTFVILSNRHEKKDLNAGEIWKTTFTLKSLENSFSPTECQLILAGIQYSYLTRDGLPGANFFEKCSLKKLDNDQWHVEGEIKLPDGIRPDQYYISAVALKKANGDSRTAIPVNPQFVNVSNQHALPPPVIRGITIEGGQPATQMGASTLTNSFKMKGDQVFTVTFVAEGRQKAFGLWFDADIFYLRETEFGHLSGTGSSESWPAVLKKTEITTVSTGTQVRMTFLLPETLYGLKIAALKMRRFYLRTSDFSWVEIDIPGKYDSMMINEKYGQ